MAFSKAKALQEAEKSVAQGKTAQAIKQYLEVLERDPSDLTLLNTVGDLYVRERNITEGLRHFHRLAEAYVREGFNVRAIAIYRKISKIEPSTVETLLKLAELYQLQGLSREAREQYLQAVDFFKKRNQADRALDVLRKLLQLDPENVAVRRRLAAEYENAGRREDAAQVYVEFAEAALRRKEFAAAEPALKKAAELDPANTRVRLLWARAALAEQPEEAERILTPSPDLANDSEGKQILLECYLATGKHSQAQELVMDVYRSNPSSFAPVSSFVSLCLEKDSVDTAFQPLAQLADELIENGNASPLMEALRRIWNKAPQHLPAMELIYRVCERTADEFGLPEILEALGHAYVLHGNLEEAATAYRQLIRREPENQHYRGLLRQVQQKMGKEAPPAPAAESGGEELALAPEGEAPAEPPEVDAEQEAMVREAIENSDLFARYRLVEKAVAELDKVLAVYPDQVEVLKRILEISHKGMPARAASAASALARIYTAQGDLATAGKYQAMVPAASASPEIPETPPQPVTSPAEEPPLAPPAPPPVTEGVPAAAPEALSSAAASLSAPPESGPAPVETVPEPSVEEPASPPSLPEAVAFDLTPPAPAAEPVAPPAEMEFDLSGDLDVLVSPVLGAATGLQREVEPPAEPESPAGTPAAAEEMPLSTPSSESVETPAEQADEAAAAPAGVQAEQPLPLVEFPLPEVSPEAGQTVEAPPAPAPEPGSETPPLEASGEPEPILLEMPVVPVAEVSEPPIEAPAHLSEVSGSSGEAGELFNYDESKLEVDFYLEHGFFEEAQQAVAALEGNYPGNDLVAGLRLHVEEKSAAAPAEREELETAETASSDEEAGPAETSAEPPHEEWDLPAGYDAETPSVANSEEPAPAISEFLDESDSVPESGGAELLNDLAADLPTSLDDVLKPTAPVEPPARSYASAPGAADLSGLLDEMDDSGFGQSPAEDDAETHYNLGVAFREMGLLEEAIGEFQKVVRGFGKGTYPPNFLQACTLLAICFMEKNMPAVAIKWYLRALEVPDLEEEAILALQYDLGVAYEQAGDFQRALERFTEVYSQNIDFRDVAEKIRALQQKV